MAEEHLIWNPDGHTLRVILNRDDLEVSLATCPNGAKPDTECWHDDVKGCVVGHFVERYGIGGNLGVGAPVSGLMEIAWAGRGNPKDVSTMDIVFLPVEDIEFASWLAEQQA